jgi:hypothetical protein
MISPQWLFEKAAWIGSQALLAHGLVAQVLVSS